MELSLWREKASPRWVVSRASDLLFPVTRAIDRLIHPGAATHGTVVYGYLGRLGRLGNQLWQIASTLGIARILGADARFPPWSYQPYFSVPDRYFTDRWLLGRDTRRYLPSGPGTHHLYLQDSRLLTGVEAEIREYFAPTPSLAAALRERHREFFAIPDKTAITVRRGDYLTSPRHSVPSERFYRAALEIAGGNVVIFSDDMPWCREHMAWADPVMFAPETPDYEQILLLAACRRYVIANSSFAWWGAYLSGSTEVIYPVRWFAGPTADDSRDMFIEGWLGLDDDGARSST